MNLTVQEVARILSVSERAVQEYISSGRLPVVHLEGAILIPASGVRSFLRPEVRVEGAAPQSSTEGEQSGLVSDVLTTLSDRMAALERTLQDQLNLAAENRELLERLRSRDDELARRRKETDKLQRELANQKRRLDREGEERDRVIRERETALREEHERRLIEQREELEKKALLEQNLWTERLARQEEDAGRKIDEARRRESLWSRLVKMMTWSTGE